MGWTWSSLCFLCNGYTGQYPCRQRSTAQANSTRNFGNLFTQEGECGRHDEYYVYGFDNCDGFIVANNAVSATASPGTQVAVTPDGFGFYLVEVNWGIGAKQVTVTGTRRRR
ncbi:MAG: hypothetical protein IPN33_19420 [Saprospiraceae bacterium]|nr:hypothetical protein [Saprospiraceae bacterium]